MRADNHQRRHSTCSKLCLPLHLFPEFLPSFPCPSGSFAPTVPTTMLALVSSPFSGPSLSIMTLALLCLLLFPCRYVRSHIDMQLAGQTGWESNVASNTQAQSCVPWINYPPSGVQINPCGLVAWSYFNDTYSVSVGAYGHY